MLNRGCARAFADLREQILALQPVVAQHPDLDEFVSFEATLDFAHHAVREAGTADDHDGIERMSARPEGAAVSGVEQFHRAHCM